MGPLLVLQTTLLTHHRVLFAFISTVTIRLALFVTVVQTALFLIGFVDILVIQHRQDITTTGRLVLLDQDEALVDTTLHFPILGQFGRVGVLVTFTVLVLEDLVDRGVCTTVLVLEFVRVVSGVEELGTTVIATGTEGVVRVDLTETVLVLIFVLLALADQSITGTEFGALVRVLITTFHIVPAITVLTGI